MANILLLYHPPSVAALLDPAEWLNVVNGDEEALVLPPATPLTSHITSLELIFLIFKPRNLN